MTDEKTSAGSTEASPALVGPWVVQSEATFLVIDSKTKDHGWTSEPRLATRFDDRKKAQELAAHYRCRVVAAEDLPAAPEGGLLDEEKKRLYGFLAGLTQMHGWSTTVYAAERELEIVARMALRRDFLTVASRGAGYVVYEVTLAGRAFVAKQAEAEAKDEQWGVWCQGEGWCSDTLGTRAHAEALLPSWASGEAADVDPSRFRYELRRRDPVIPRAKGGRSAAHAKRGAAPADVNARQTDLEARRAREVLDDIVRGAAARLATFTDEDKIDLLLHEVAKAHGGQLRIDRRPRTTMLRAALEAQGRGLVVMTGDDNDEAAFCSLSPTGLDVVEAQRRTQRRSAIDAAPATHAAPPGAEAMLAELRREGWRVAIHNDYRLAGEERTFWGFSAGDRWMKGEGKTDAEALGECYLAHFGTPWSDEEGDDSDVEAEEEAATAEARGFDSSGLPARPPAERVNAILAAYLEAADRHTALEEPTRAVGDLLAEVHALGVGADRAEVRRLTERVEWTKKMGQSLAASEAEKRGRALDERDAAQAQLAEAEATLEAERRVAKDRDALAEETIIAFRQRADQLQVALRPFAEASATIPATTGPHATIYMPGDTSYTRLRVQCFRDAALVLAGAALPEDPVAASRLLCTRVWSAWKDVKHLWNAAGGDDAVFLTHPVKGPAETMVDSIDAIARLLREKRRAAAAPAGSGS